MSRATSKQRYYDWNKLFSYQTGTIGEFAIIVGGKGIGKTFGLRLSLIRRCMRSGARFVELCRSKAEADNVSKGYFDKLQQEGFFKEYQFKTESGIGYFAPAGDDKPEWEPICYFVALTSFQQEKKRTFAHVQFVIFDEFIIDRRDRYRRYLPNEFSILANILDTIFRETPDDDTQRRVYMIGNAADFTCPYFRAFGIDKIPEYGFSYHHNKSVILHYVEPWDAEDRKARTLVGRMLEGSDEAAMVFDNRFAIAETGDISDKPSNAQFSFGLVFKSRKFGIWADRGDGLYYINEQVPKNAKAVFALTKSDYTLDYNGIQSADDLLRMMVRLHYLGALRYKSAAIREAFFEILDFLGVR